VPSQSDPVVTNNGENVENQSVINQFSDNSTLTLTCTSDDQLDVVEWIMINKTGIVRKQFTNVSNVSSSITLINPSDSFTSILRCSNLYYRHLYKDEFITKGNILGLQ